jgi:hypothetical protein
MADAPINGSLTGGPLQVREVERLAGSATTRAATARPSPRSICSDHGWLRNRRAGGLQVLRLRAHGKRSRTYRRAPASSDGRSARSLRWCDSISCLRVLAASTQPSISTGAEVAARPAERSQLSRGDDGSGSSSACPAIAFWPSTWRSSQRAHAGSGKLARPGRAGTIGCARSGVLATARVPDLGPRARSRYPTADADRGTHVRQGTDTGRVTSLHQLVRRFPAEVRGSPARGGT